MTPDERVQYIEGILKSLTAGELNSGRGISDFDKTRLSANLGILNYEGLATNAKATKDLTRALEQASSASEKTSHTLNKFTSRLVWATILLAVIGLFQACEMMRQNNIAEKNLQPSTPSNSPPLTAQPQAPAAPPATAPEARPKGPN